MVRCLLLLLLLLRVRYNPLLAIYFVSLLLLVAAAAVAADCYTADYNDVLKTLLSCRLAVLFVEAVRRARSTTQSTHKPPPR